jgi:thioredoxin reductase
MTWCTSPRPGTLTNAERTELAARAVDVVEGVVEQLVIHQDRLCGVQLQDGCVARREALFVSPRFVPNDNLLLGLGCAVDGKGWVTVDATGRTSVPGVWAVGNVVNPRAQVITAAGEGSAAAIAINADLVQEDVERAVAAVADRPFSAAMQAPVSDLIPGDHRHGL